MPRNRYSDTERAHCVIWYLEGHVTTAIQRLFLGIIEHLQLDQQYGVGAKTINQEGLKLIRVEMDAHKLVKRTEFE